MENNSQVKANPTKATLDAAEHEADLESQRQKRKDSTIENTTGNVTAERKSATDDGNCEEQSVDDEYSVQEGKKRSMAGKASPTVVIGDKE